MIIHRGTTMRACIAMMLSVMATVSLAAAGDSLPDPETKPLLERIADTRFEFSANPQRYLPEYKPDQEYFIDVREIKRWRSFKPAACIYSVYAGIRTYRRHDGIKFKSYLGDEPDVTTSFEMGNGNRVYFVTSKFPFILFPWGEKHRIDRAVAIQMTGGGAVVIYAFTIDGHVHPFKSLQKKEDKRN